jgi:hypothetical protein
VLGVELLDQRACPVERHAHLLDFPADAPEVGLQRGLFGTCCFQVPLIAAYHHRRRLGEGRALPPYLGVHLAYRRMIVAVAQSNGRPRRFEPQEPRIE